MPDCDHDLFVSGVNNRVAPSQRLEPLAVAHCATQRRHRPLSQQIANAPATVMATLSVCKDERNAVLSDRALPRTLASVAAELNLAPSESVVLEIRGRGHGELLISSTRQE
jgi:hypothetical protein